MKKAWFIVGCILVASAAIGCKNRCQRACEHVAECTGGDDSECDKSCKEMADDTEGQYDKKEVKKAAKCVLDLSCGDIKADPIGSIAECY